MSSFYVTSIIHYIFGIVNGISMQKSKGIINLHPDFKQRIYCKFNLPMLFINHEDIGKAADAKELVGAIEHAYSVLSSPGTLIPDRMHVNYGNNTLLLMPGFTENIFGTKLVSVFPENKLQGKPAIFGVMVLNDALTGEPVAMLNGTALTARRTGAVGATAVKHLAPGHSETLGVIGAGVQAFYQAVSIVKNKTFKKLIIGARNLKKAEGLKTKLQQELTSISIECTTDINSLVLNSDVIVTATSSFEPVFNVEAGNLANKTIVAIGSYKPDMQELPLSVFKNAGKVFTDTLHAKAESGDIKIPLEKGLIKDDDVIPFNRLLEDPGLRNEGLNIFKSVGMALFDLTCAELILRKAKEKNLGTEIKL